MKPLPKILLIILVLIILLFLNRLISPREIDDVNPYLNCTQEYLEKSEIFWIIPYYHEIPISENKNWCQEILELNKTLGLHGIRHQPYQEFKTQNITQEELDEAMKIFQDCFNQTPTMFKSPNLEISNQNKKLIKNNKLKLRTKFKQTIHKVYHCNDSGTLPNWFHDIF